MGKSVQVSNVPNGPAFSAYRSTNQSITLSTWTKVECNTEEFDTAGAYDNATNYRFQPTVAGYYQISGGMLATGTSMGNVGIAVHKNGAVYKTGNIIAASLTGNTECSMSCLVYLNGSTDYVELFGYIFANSPAFFAGSNYTYFQGVLVRPA